MRSSSGRDSLARYPRFSPTVHTHASSEAQPRRQGLAAPTSWNRAGKAALPAERDTTTLPSSRGWRRDSSTRWENSGSSSRKSTPRCARLASPGCGTLPPPISPAPEAVPRRQEPGHAPHRGDLDRLLEIQGRQDGAETAGEHRFARARRAEHQEVVAARRRDLQRALGPEMAPHVGEVEPVGLWPCVPGVLFVAVSADLALAIQVLEGIVERGERDNRDSADHCRLGRVTRGYEEARDPAAPAVQRHRKHSSDRPDVAV